MMGQILYGDVKAAIARVTDLCDDDPRVMEYTNRAQQELMGAVSEFIGKHVRLRVCVLNGNITWPDYLETISKVMVDNAPYQTRDMWFEFLDNAVGGQEAEDYSWGALGLQLDRGDVVSFDDINGANKKLKVYCDVTEEAGAKIRLGGLGSAGTRIRSATSGQWTDGEEILLDNVTPQVSVNVFKTFDLAVKPVTNGYVRIYELDTVTSVERLLAIYSPWQTRPAFRRSFIPGIACECPRTVQVIGKVRHIPVRSDNDFLLIPNENAIISAARSIHLRDASKFELSVANMETAKRLLNEQFTQWRGEDTKAIFQAQSRLTAGFGGLMSFGVRG